MGRREERTIRLITCERIEFYAIEDLSDTPASQHPTPLDPDVRITTARGVDAARHLFRVAAGLESRFVGESHVLGQVIGALRGATARGTTDAFLTRLFSHAIRTGRRVRRETALGRLAGSYVEAAVARLIDDGAIVNDVADSTSVAPSAHGQTSGQTSDQMGGQNRTHRIRTIGVIGSGAMARELVSALAERGVPRIVVMARHHEALERLRARLGTTHPGSAITLVPLDALRREIDALDGLVTATSSPRVLVECELVATRTRSLRIVDLGALPNVDPGVRSLRVNGRVELTTLAELSGPHDAGAAIAEAERIVEASVQRWMTRASTESVRHGGEIAEAASPVQRTVILAAHGAGNDSDANLRIEALRTALAAESPDVEFLAAFNLGTPRFHEALDAARGSSVTVVPLMTSDGWFVRERLPAELRRSPRMTDGSVEITRPVGSVPSLVDAVVARALGTIRAIATEGARDRVAVVVVGHGTRRSATSGDATRAVADRIAAALLAPSDPAPGASRLSITMHVAFLDDDPTLESVAATLDGDAVVVVPFLIGGGDHARRDVAERLDAGLERATCERSTRKTRSGRSGRLSHASRSVHRTILPALTDDELATDLADAVRCLMSLMSLMSRTPQTGCAPKRVLRLGTRGSILAHRQTTMVVEALAAHGIETEVAEITTRGDLDRRTPLDEFGGDGVFTDELEVALAEGAIDLAVHSLKDLPLAETPRTTVGAVLARGAADEALVARGGETLAELPSGARIGTSSARRAAQLRLLRPDLTLVPLRGPVDARLDAVATGELDGAILAVAGLERLGALDRISERFEIPRFVPEAGQGAIVITLRRDDAAARGACRAIDHPSTRSAVELERDVAAAIQRAGRSLAAAHASPEADGLLHVRAIEYSTGAIRAVVVVRTEHAATLAVALRALEDAPALSPVPPGPVHLVGAGPGDAGLLTLRGAALLGEADVVIHDRLVSDEVLAMIRSGASRIDAGKASGGRGMTQESINRLIVSEARRGRCVVRLKGGDPFVFGRGSEELEACRSAGIRCDVVPGISSALAAPAVAGIPVTARGIARSVAVVTARSGEEFDDEPVDVEALAKLDTIVLLMGRERLERFARELIDAGRDAETPAAVIERATWPDERRVVATLGTIAAAADAARIEAPAVVVVGPTAGWGSASCGATPIASTLAQASLAGLRVAVTRPRSASTELVAELRSRGADVLEMPLIAVELLDPAPPLPDLSEYDWIVLTSQHGARGFARALDRAGLDGRALGGCRIAAVGPRTARELWIAARLHTDLVPSEHRAAALVTAMGRAMHESTAHRLRREPGGEASVPSVLFPCGTLAREETASGLRALGATVDEIVVYETRRIAPTPRLRSRLEASADTGLDANADDRLGTSTGRGLDAILLYSPSSVRSLVEHDVPIGDAAILCVGPTTAAEVVRLGLGTPRVAEEYGDRGVIALLESLVVERRSSRSDALAPDAATAAVSSCEPATPLMSVKCLTSRTSQTSRITGPSLAPILEATAS